MVCIKEQEKGVLAPKVCKAVLCKSCVIAADGSVDRLVAAAYLILGIGAVVGDAELFDDHGC